jgi:carbonic anhydrase
MTPETHPENPVEALRALQAGNERHRAGKQEFRTHSPLGEWHAEGQRPFAAIIACADSRLSPSLIFDLAPGNLFVSRIAGNSVDTGTLGSTEFAVAVLGVKVVVVLGHSDCGAVKAAIEVADGTRSYPSEDYGSIGQVVDAVVPSVAAVPAEQRRLPNCIAANARAQAAAIAGTEPIIEPAVAGGMLGVVAAVYEIETSSVKLL